MAKSALAGVIVKSPLSVLITGSVSAPSTVVCNWSSWSLLRSEAESDTAVEGDLQRHGAAITEHGDCAIEAHRFISGIHVGERQGFHHDVVE